LSTLRAAWLGWAALLVGATLVLAESCTGPRTYGEHPDAAPAHASSPPGLDLWVDAHAAEGGDGTSTRPFRRLQEALALTAPRRQVHLAPGLYPGPFIATDGTELVGGSATVLTADGPVTVLEAQGTVSLRRLLVQGGRVGLRAAGSVRLSAVRFSGQRAAAISLAAGTTLEADATLLEATVSEALGLAIEAGARARLSGCTFEGPWRRGIEGTAPENLTVTKSRFRGAVIALHLRGGLADLSDVTISEGRGPGLYVVGGTLRLHRVQVTGHEYALLTGTGAVVEAEDFTSTRADRAGVAVVNATARFTRLTITFAGTFGGLQGVASDLTVEHLLVEDVAGTGVSMRQGSLRLDQGKVRRMRDPDGSAADGVVFRGGRATVTDLEVQETGGACVVAAEGSELLLSRSTLERCRTAGLVAETGARVSASVLTVQTSDGPGAVATSDATLVLRGFRATSTAHAVWAECAAGAHVAAWGVVGTLPSLPCVEALLQPPPASPAGAR
jgi:hypothetical protein